MEVKHKWAKEIKAFVDGKDVEYRIEMFYEPKDQDAMYYDVEWTDWSKVYNLLAFDNDSSYQFRVKPKDKK
jgi:long-subunit fatty acid transport protein